MTDDIRLGSIAFERLARLRTDQHEIVRKLAGFSDDGATSWEVAHLGSLSKGLEGAL
ncbi:MAG: hypothetical protein WBN04_20490 [Paracoccaceae bacterium]